MTMMMVSSSEKSIIHIEINGYDVYKDYTPPYSPYPTRTLKETGNSARIWSENVDYCALSGPLETGETNKLDPCSGTAQLSGESGTFVVRGYKYNSAPAAYFEVNLKK